MSSALSSGVTGLQAHQKMLDIAAKITQNPVEVSIEGEAQTVEKIDQRVIEVNPENRGPLLRALLKKEKWKMMIGKTMTKTMTMKMMKTKIIKK